MQAKEKKQCMRNGGGKRSQCGCLGSDSPLFRGPQRRAQSVLVQVLLVFTVMLCLSACQSVCLTQSHSLGCCLKSEFYWWAHLDTMNNFSPLNGGMKRKRPYPGMRTLPVRLLECLALCASMCIHLCVSAQDGECITG